MCRYRHFLVTGNFLPQFGKSAVKLVIRYLLYYWRKFLKDDVLEYFFLKKNSYNKKNMSIK